MLLLCCWVVFFLANLISTFFLLLMVTKNRRFSLLCFFMYHGVSYILVFCLTGHIRLCTLCMNCLYVSGNAHEANECMYLFVMPATHTHTQAVSELCNIPLPSQLNSAGPSPWRRDYPLPCLSQSGRGSQHEVSQPALPGPAPYCQPGPSLPPGTAGTLVLNQRPIYPCHTSSAKWFLLVFCRLSILGS